MVVNHYCEEVSGETDYNLPFCIVKLCKSPNVHEDNFCTDFSISQPPIAARSSIFEKLKIRANLLF